MGIIQKRADQIRPGDVVVLAEMNGGTRGVVVQPDLIANSVRTGEVRYFQVALAGESGAKITSWGWEPEVELNVEVPDLTPAQQHADELLKSLSIMLDSLAGVRPMSAAELTACHALRNELTPPTPPTLAEALELIQQIVEREDDSIAVEAGTKLLDRARRANLL